MQTQMVNIDDIQEASYNPRSINNYEMKGLIESIRHFGCTQPLIINKTTNTLVSGHQRLKAMRELNYKEVPVVYVELDLVQEKALNITMNNKHITGEFTSELQTIIDDIRNDTSLDFLIDLNLDTLIIEMPKEDEDIQEEKPVSPNKKLSDVFLIAPFSVINTTSKEFLDLNAKYDDSAFIGVATREDVEAYTTNRNKYDYMPTIKGTSEFKPALCEILYLWFCSKYGRILDPFCGGAVRGGVASEQQYSYVGFDVREEQIKLNKQVVPNATYICDSSLNLDKYYKTEEFDFIFSCPPYAYLEVYSEQDNDISNKSYTEFLQIYQEIIAKCYKVQKNNSFACFVVSEVRSKQKNGEYINFVSDTINAFISAGYQYYNEIILIDSCGSLPIRAGKAFNSSRKIGRRHQNILVFLKGDAKLASDKCQFVEEINDR